MQPDLLLRLYLHKMQAHGKRFTRQDEKRKWREKFNFYFWCRVILVISPHTSHLLFLQDSSLRPILHPPPGHSPSIRTQLVGNLSAFRDKEETEVREDRVMERLRLTTDARLIAGEDELGGRNRYAADGLLNSTDCNLLMQLAQVSFFILRVSKCLRPHDLDKTSIESSKIWIIFAERGSHISYSYVLQIAVEGDGYEDNKSPHSFHERFEGATVGRMALVRIVRKCSPLSSHAYYPPAKFILWKKKKKTYCRWSTSAWRNRNYWSCSCSARKRPATTWKGISTLIDHCISPTPIWSAERPYPVIFIWRIIVLLTTFLLACSHRNIRYAIKRIDNRSDRWIGSLTTLWSHFHNSFY